MRNARIVMKNQMTQSLHKINQFLHQMSVMKKVTWNGVLFKTMGLHKAPPGQRITKLEFKSENRPSNESINKLAKMMRRPGANIDRNQSNDYNSDRCRSVRDRLLAKLKKRNN